MKPCVCSNITWHSRASTKGLLPFSVLPQTLTHPIPVFFPVQWGSDACVGCRGICGTWQMPDKHGTDLGLPSIGHEVPGFGGKGLIGLGAEPSGPHGHSSASAPGPSQFPSRHPWPRQRAKPSQPQAQNTWQWPGQAGTWHILRCQQQVQKPERGSPAQVMVGLHLPWGPAH